VDLVLGVFAQLAKEMPELRMIMLGDGSMRDDIDQAVRRFGLDDKIHLKGRVAYADLPAYYQAADVYISASYSDGSSVSLLEAMATGLICVVSDIPGNREWIAHDVDGFLFESGNAESLTNILRHCIERRDTWPQLGRIARTQVIQRADWMKNSPKLFDAYRSAIQNTLRSA
jgi:glycosyltransferase involved in cell wall biosynthesis